MTTNRFSFIIVLGVIAALAVLTVSMVASPRTSPSTIAYDQIERIRAAKYAAAAAQQAYLDQRHGEWTAGEASQTTGAAADAQQISASAFDQVELMRAANYAAAAAQQAYLDQRRGEWTAGESAADAYLNYRRGEWTGK